MKPNRLIMALPGLLALLLLVAACENDNTAEPLDAYSDVYMHETDNGDTLWLALDERLVTVLDARPGEDRLWFYEGMTNPILTLQADTLYSGSGELTAAAVQTFTFVPEALGMTRMLFEYRAGDGTILRRLATWVVIEDAEE